jgi:hypothetical protein
MGSFGLGCWAGFATAPGLSSAGTGIDPLHFIVPDLLAVILSVIPLHIQIITAMVLLQQLKQLLLLGSLAARSAAAPGASQRPFREDDDDDTPLPLVIWHGAAARSPYPR